MSSHQSRCRTDAVRIPSFSPIPIVVLLAFTVVLQSRAQIETPGPTARAAEQQGHSVSGTVVNSVTGEPIARALVTWGGQRYTMTDSNGGFRFDGMLSGGGTLSAEKPGYFNAQQVEPSDPTTWLNVATGTDNVTLKLIPQAIITGRITSQNGQPIEDFPVRLYSRRIDDGRAQWQQIRTVQTDDDGQFRIAGLQPGPYCLSAGPETMRMRAPSFPRGFPLIFYPNTPDLASATLIPLSAGQQFQADLQLDRVPLYQISGEVLGAPDANWFALNLFTRDGEQVDRLRPRSMREFSGYVPAGQYTLNAVARGQDGTFTGSVPLNVAGNLSGIRVATGQEPSIPVNVKIESNAPPRSAQQPYPAVVWLKSNQSSLRPTVSSSSPVKRPGEPPSIVISSVQPGSYSVEVQPLGPYYVQSATSGAIDLLHDQLVIPSSGRVESIEVVLRDDGGRVNVIVNRESPHATVLLIPERGSPSQIMVERIQGNGEFSFGQVRPGDYMAIALDRVSDLEYRNPDVLSPYLSNATHITVAPRQQMQVNLELIHVGK